MARSAFAIIPPRATASMTQPLDKSAGEARLGETIAGRYRLDEILGHGGAGIVFGATHVLTERRVAVKLVDTTSASEANVTRLMKEARATVRLAHPNVVEVLDMGQLDDGAVYLALELLRGKSLAERLKGRKRLSLDETLTICAPIMDAMAAAHDAGLVHRDLKPGNIFLHEDQGKMVPKLLDFGVVKSTDPNAVRQTQVGIVLGTPHFMSPEQARGLPDIGPPVDVWAMGVVLYRTLSGFLPFRGKNVPQVLRAITRGEYIPLWEHVPSLAGPVVRVIEDALTLDPRLRFSTMREFLEALEIARKGTVVQRTPVELPSGDLPLESADLGGNTLRDFYDPDEEVTPLPSKESLEIPEYRDTYSSGAHAQTKDGTSGRRALPFVIGFGVLAAVAAGAYTLSDRWMAEQLAPIEVAAEAPPTTAAAGRAIERVEVPDEVPEAPDPEPVAKVAPPPPPPPKKEEAPPPPPPPPPPDTRAQDGALAAQKRATDAREAFATSRAALQQRVQQAERMVESTDAMARRAREPADKRTADAARKAARRDLDVARAARADCDKRARTLAKDRPLDARWTAADAALRTRDWDDAQRELEQIADISEKLVAACGVKKAAPQEAPAAQAMVAAEASAAAPAEAAPKRDARAEATGHYQRALALKKRGDRSGAIAALSQAIALVPEFVAAYNSRGLLKQAAGDIPGAIRDFDAANRIEPDNAGVLNNRGYVKLAKHDLDGALADFDAAIARDGRNALFFENRGAARYLKGRFQDAATDFGRAVEIDPKLYSAYRRRARTLQKLGDHAAAKADFDRLLAAQPNDADTLYARGRTNVELDLTDAAIEDFGKVIALAPKRADAYLRRGLCYVTKNDAARARADLEKHLELAPNSRHAKVAKHHLARLGAP